MSHSQKTVLATIGIVALLSGLPDSANALSFTFTKIVDSSMGFDPFDFGSPSLNNNGEVAFRARPQTGELGIFRGSGGVLTPIVKTPEQFNFIGFFPSINDKGEVAFAATIRDNGEGIFRGSGDSLTRIADTDGSLNFFSFFPSLNNNGAVAFQAELDNFAEGLFVGSGGTLTTIFETDNSPFDDSFSGPSLNDFGQIAFEAGLDTGERGIFLFDNGIITTIADDTDALGSLDDFPSLNNNGLVAFSAFLKNGEQAIFTGNGGNLTTVANTSGSFLFLNDSPSLNEQGEVAFSALLDTGEGGIFLATEEKTEPVILTGEKLDGAVVTNVVLFREGLNDLSQVAFLAQFDDGTEAIYRATPTARQVPEGMGLIGAGTALSWGIFSKRKRKANKSGCERV